MRRFWPTLIPFIFLLFAIFAVPAISNAQTTGKIAGKVVDADTKEPLSGAQIMITAKWGDNKEIK